MSGAPTIQLATKLESHLQHSLQPINSYGRKALLSHMDFTWNYHSKEQPDQLEPPYLTTTSSCQTHTLFTFPLIMCQYKMCLAQLAMIVFDFVDDIAVTLSQW